MNTELLISCDDWENRVAVLEEGSLAEIYFEREEKVIGSIYKGRVENVLPGMGACFVNIGLGRNAFLYVDDIRRDPINIGETEITDRRKGHTVGELLKVGDDVLVQIVKEPRGLKGARVSTNISLPGRYLVLMPTGRYSGVSSRIEDENERTRLKQIMRRVRPEGMATIVRTAARGVSEAELIADLGVQLRLWHGILESYKRAAAPALLHKDLNLVFKAVRDFMTSDVRQVTIDSKEQYEEIRSTMSLLGPQYLSRLKLWEGPGDLFEARGINEELQKLLKPKIMLPSGGYLILEHTEALTVIDVNTGKFTGGRNLEDTIVRTNVEAAAEIARQVRLRDIGGIIVVDFIDMAHERSRQQVIDTLTEALKRDRTRSTIQVFSNLGLLEFTRKRVGKDLAGQLRSDCPYCSGLGDVMSSESLAIGVLRQLKQRERNGARGKRLDLVVDPSVATQLVGWYREEFEKLVKDLGADVQLFVEPQRHRESITLEHSRRTHKPLAAGKEVETELLNVRLPDPGAGVAAVDGNIIEVKDAANGAGQPAKLRVTSVDGYLARAELAEPLQTAQRRRRRGRGKGKAAVETEAPIAPPTPHRQAASELQRKRERVHEEPPAAAARREMAPLAYDLLDEEEEDYTLRGGRIAGGSVGAGSPSRGGVPGKQRREEAGAERASRARGRHGPRRPAPGPQPLVVGGEGDIDYDEDDDSVVIVPAARGDRQGAARTASLEREEEHEGQDVRRRRRRRGRGRIGEAAADGTREGFADEEIDVDEVEERPAPASQARGRDRSVGERGQRADRELRDRGERGLHDRGERHVRDRAERDVRERGERDVRDRAERDVRERGERDVRDRGRRDLRDRGERDPRDRGEGERSERLRREAAHSGGYADAERGKRDDFRQRDVSQREAYGARGRGGAQPQYGRGARESHVAREQREYAERELQDRRDERSPRTPAQRHYGPIQQLYGRPLDMESAPPRRRAERLQEEHRHGEPPHGERERDRERADFRDEANRARTQREQPDEDLDMVIEAESPASMDVRYEPAPPRRRGREARPERERGGPEDERQQRPPGRRFGRRETAEAAPPPVRRTIKQLYPPPGSEEEPLEDDGPRGATLDTRRAPRGPMMRSADAEPPPKGKVRQLYPPPEFSGSDEKGSAQEAPAHAGSAPDDALGADEPGTFEGSHAVAGRPESMFVSDAQELEERRRLARERALQRRREEAPVNDPPPTSEWAPLRGPFEDEEE